MFKEILESPVGAIGRTGVKDAEAHVTDELRAEFRKIVKKLGGKTVAGQLLRGPVIKGDITEEELDEARSNKQASALTRATKKLEGEKVTKDFIKKVHEISDEFSVDADKLLYEIGA